MFRNLVGALAVHYRLIARQRQQLHRGSTNSLTCRSSTATMVPPLSQEMSEPGQTGASNQTWWDAPRSRLAATFHLARSSPGTLSPAVHVNQLNSTS
jgi:hypothetical protein